MSLRGTLPSSSMISAIWSTDGRRLQEERGRHRQHKQQIHQTVSQSPAHSGCVGGGRTKRLKAHTLLSDCCRGWGVQTYIYKSGYQTWPPDIIKAERFLNSRIDSFSFAIAVNQTFYWILSKFNGKFIPQLRWNMKRICKYSVISLFLTGLFLYFSVVKFTHLRHINIFKSEVFVNFHRNILGCRETEVLLFSSQFKHFNISTNQNKSVH